MRQADHSYRGLLPALVWPIGMFAIKTEVTLSPFRPCFLKLPYTADDARLWSHSVQLRRCTTVQCTAVVYSSKPVTVLKMGIDIMFPLDTSPPLKIPIFEKQKDVCVGNFNFRRKREREKKGRIPHAFPQLLSNRPSFIIIS